LSASNIFAKFQQGMVYIPHLYFAPSAGTLNTVWYKNVAIFDQ